MGLHLDFHLNFQLSFRWSSSYFSKLLSFLLNLFWKFFKIDFEIESFFLFMFFLFWMKQKFIQAKFSFISCLLLIHWENHPNFSKSLVVKNFKPSTFKDSKFLKIHEFSNPNDDFNLNLDLMKRIWMFWFNKLFSHSFQTYYHKTELPSFSQSNHWSNCLGTSSASVKNYLYLLI